MLPPFFDDEAAEKVLTSAIQSTDAFMIFEMTHRTFPCLLNTTIVILSVFITTLYDFYWSPIHLLFTYLIPVVPIFYAIDGYVSCTRGRTADKTWELLYRQPNVNLSEWELKSGEQTALLPFGKLYWYSAVKKSSRKEWIVDGVVRSSILSDGEKDVRIQSLSVSVFYSLRNPFPKLTRLRRR